MQIFEITQRQPVNEGALSAIAGGIGRSLADKFVRSTLPGVSMYDEPTQAVPTLAAATKQSNASATNTGATQNTPSWVGTNTNVPAVQRKQAAQAAASTTTATAPAATTAQTAQPAATVPAASVTQPAPAATGVIPKVGHRIVVQAANGGKYYKTDKGWTNEIGQAVTNTGSIATLEKLADAAGREERIPTMSPPARAGKPAGKPIKTRRRR